MLITTLRADMVGRITRRDVLKIGGSFGAFGISGCSSTVRKQNRGTRTSARDATTTTRMGDRTSTELSVGKSYAMDEGGEVTIQAIDHQYSTYYLSSPDAVDVLDPTERQLLFVTVRTTDSGDTDNLPARNEFEVVVGGNEYSAINEIDGVTTSRIRPDLDSVPEYSAGKHSGWIAFTIPTEQLVENPYVVWERDGGETVKWQFSGGVSERLSAPAPDFRVTEFHAPKSTTMGTPIHVAITVENSGGVGAFRSSFNQQSVSYEPRPFTFDVSAGDSESKTATLRYPNDVDKMRYRFTSHTHDQQFTVDIKES